MARYDLNETLTAFLVALDVPPESGLAIDEVELEVPLEIRLIDNNGVLQVSAQPPGSIYHSGFESLVQRTRFVAGMIEIEKLQSTTGRTDGQRSAQSGTQESSHETGH